jgi:tyrosine-protein phosphatase SIW14
VKRFREVVPGKLYRGGSPSPKDVAWLKEKFGIKKIVSLDQKTGERIDRACKLLGIEHIMIPIDGSRRSLMQFLGHDLKKLFLDGGPTLVHCAEGKDRTSLASALVECKYMGMDPEDAIKEAKSLGFGIGVDSRIVHLFEKIIRNCKPVQDTNSADIVSNEREYISDNRSGILDEGHQGSFAPFLSKTRQWPYDPTYLDIQDQSPTRENYQTDWADKKKQETKTDEGKEVPLVGEYNNNAGIVGFGPALNPGGFIYD